MKKAKDSSSPIKLPGQRLIPSSFLFRSSNPSTATDGKGDVVKTAASDKGRRVSLSDFLDRKLHNASLLPNTRIQGKQVPVLSRLNSGSISEKIGVKREKETEVLPVIREAVLKQFSYNKNEHHDSAGSSSGDKGNFELDDGRNESRKRRNPFEGGVEKASTLKRVVVLGDDPKPTRRRRDATYINKNKERPLYNHYANGKGWWGDDMEGLDSDVGHSEVWEGMGSTTLGGLEWH